MRLPIRMHGMSPRAIAWYAEILPILRIFATSQTVKTVGAFLLAAIREPSSAALAYCPPRRVCGHGIQAHERTILYEYQLVNTGELR